MPHRVQETDTSQHHFFFYLCFIFFLNFLKHCWLRACKQAFHCKVPVLYLFYLAHVTNKNCLDFTWAKKNEQWTLDQWKSVLWSDEYKFEIFGSNRHVFVRRRVGEWMDG